MVEILHIIAPKENEADSLAVEVDAEATTATAFQQPFRSLTHLPTL